jgi:hypothetical protein
MTLAHGGLLGNAIPLTDAHLHSLRQIGYEILNSPDLGALASETFERSV